MGKDGMEVLSWNVQIVLLCNAVSAVMEVAELGPYLRTHGVKYVIKRQRLQHYKWI